MKSILELEETSRRRLDILPIQPLLSMENGWNFENQNRYISGAILGMAVFTRLNLSAALGTESMPEIVGQSPSRSFVVGPPSLTHCKLSTRLK